MLRIKKANYNDINIINYFFNNLIKYESNFDNNINSNNIIINDYYKTFNNNHYVTYIIFDDNIPIGYIHGFISNYKNNIFYETISFIDTIYIIDEYRNMGIGKYLIEKFIEWSKQKKAGYIELMVMNKNINAIKLYKKMGFIEISSKMQMKI